MDDTNLLPARTASGVPAQGQPLPAQLQGEEASPLEKIKQADQAREGFPGEHWLVLGMGIALWHFTRRNRNALVRAAGSFGAAALVARAASGREGLAKVLRWTPLGAGIRRSCPPCEAGSARR